MKHAADLQVPKPPVGRVEFAIDPVRPHSPTRRRMVLETVALSCGALGLPASAQPESSKDPLDRAAALPEIDPWVWFEQLASAKELGRPLSVKKFLDRWYWLNEEVWRQPDGRPDERVTAPRGFVTDLASIPRVFWSVLAPDDQYAYAAVIHDWLYWTQAHLGKPIQRRQADRVMVETMRELDVSGWKIAAIDWALDHFGQAAWDGNAARRAAGEKRVLRLLPDSALTRWETWRQRPDVFWD